MSIRSKAPRTLGEGASTSTRFKCSPKPWKNGLLSGFHWARQMQVTVVFIHLLGSPSLGGPSSGSGFPSRARRIVLAQTPDSVRYSSSTRGASSLMLCDELPYRKEPDRESGFSRLLM